MKHESHLRHFRSKYLGANINPNLGQQCKEKSWAEETLTGSWAPRVLWWENVEEMGVQILGYNSCPCSIFLNPEELDWQACLSWLEGKRRLDTRVPGNLHSHVGVLAVWCREWACRCHLERWWIGRWAYRCHLKAWQNLVGNWLIDAIWKCWSHKRFLSDNLCILRKTDVFLACYRCLIFNLLMQMCPG